MVSIYEELQGVATGVLREFNQGVITYVELTKGNGPAHNPGPPTRTEYTFGGAVASGPEFKFMSTGLAVASDKQVTTEVDPRFTPSVSGKMIIDGIEYKIKHFQPVPSAGVADVWKFICAKA